MPQEGFPFKCNLVQSWCEHPLVMGGKERCSQQTGCFCAVLDAVLCV